MPEQLRNQKRSDKSETDDAVDDDAQVNAETDETSSVSGLRRSTDSVILGLETEKVLDSLHECRGNRRATARELKISERKLYRLLKRYEEMGIEVPRPYQ